MDFDLLAAIDTIWVWKTAAIVAVIVAYQVFQLAWYRAIDRIANYRTLSSQRVVTARRIAQLLGRTGLLAAIALIISIEFGGLLVLLGAISAAIGIALFAQWSILSNITTSIIMYWRFPIHIGDRIGLQGKEEPLGTVQDLTAFFIILADDKGNTITIPNNQALQQNFVIYNSLSPEGAAGPKEGPRREADA